MERTMQEKEELEMDHCEETEVREELLRIVQEKASQRGRALRSGGAL